MKIFYGQSGRWLVGSILEGMKADGVLSVL